MTLVYLNAGFCFMTRCWRTTASDQVHQMPQPASVVKGKKMQSTVYYIASDTASTGGRNDESAVPDTGQERQNYRHIRDLTARSSDQQKSEKNYKRSSLWVHISHQSIIINRHLLISTKKLFHQKSFSVCFYKSFYKWINIAVFIGVVNTKTKPGASKAVIDQQQQLK